MTRIKNIFIKMPVQRFLTIIILIFTLVPSLITSLVLYHYTRNDLTREQAEDYTNAIFLEINDSITAILRQLDSFNINLLNYGDLSLLGGSNSYSAEDKSQLFKETLEKIFPEKSSIYAVDFIASDGTLYHYGAPISCNNYEQFAPKLSRNAWTFNNNCFLSDNNFYFAIGRRLYSYKKSYELGSIIFYIHEEKINYLQNGTAIPRNKFFISVDNHIISHPQKEYIGTTPYMPAVDSQQTNSYDLSDNYTYFSHLIDNSEISNEIMVSGIISNEVLFASTNNLIRNMLIIAVILSVSAIFLTLIRTRKIVSELTALKNSIHSFTDNYETPPKKASSNEITALESSFYKMSEDINKLIDEIKVEKEKQHVAEITALQSQINPHFIYNALDSISWLAKENEQYEIDEMLITLSNFLRLGLHNGDTFIKLQDEIGHVKSYLEIEERRFPDVFDVEFNIDETLFDIYVLKIVLQPIVENSIRHGFKNIEYKGHILIKAYRTDDGVEFSITDNGVGMEMPEGDKIPKSRNPKGGYGLYNVNARLVAHYGKDCALRFYSTPSKGTTVKFKIHPQSNIPV